MSISLSNDGVGWCEVDDVLFESMLKDESADFWIDLTGDLGFNSIHVTAFRRLLEQAKNGGESSATLYGIPVVYTEGDRK